MTADTAEALALGALGWILSDDDRAERLLSLTGMTPDGLRAAIGERGTLAAVLEFLVNHEPDLLGAAEHLGTDPATLVDAQRILSR
ncbi:DUF3572 domain-containing protein [Qipengyuania sp. JC766]|uniref:DUF3572 domain-containing protein n=1 Tax=Qipengyuania sp. JC766 TaxID=3232139 RepID=UPI00345B13A4